MENADFDRALIGAAFALAAERGWREVSVAEAARRADLPLDRARRRFPTRGAVLWRFGRMADETALARAPTEGPHRDRLFDLLMRRFDVLEAHRAGVLALLRVIPSNPKLALFLSMTTERSMGWMLEAAGISTTGVLGRLRRKGLLGVWLAAVRAWREDTSEDLSGTMAALDRALGQAERVEGWLTGRRRTPAEPPPPPEEMAPEAPSA